MDSCICGSVSNFYYTLNEDIGFEHNSYNPLLSIKKYRICKNCLSIKREDKEIRNPFNSDYKHSPKKCITASNRLRTISDFIVKSIDNKNIKNICDFGGGEGELLLFLKNKFPQARLNLVEIKKQEKDQGINHFSSLGELLEKERIDIFIASNSLLYTDYSELIDLLSNTKNSPNYVILSGPDIRNRPSQLFYDDVIYNASRLGIKLLLNRFGYKFEESNLYNIDHKEYLILGQKFSGKFNQNNISINSKQICIKKLKNQIINRSKYQAEIANKERAVTIFGTSIDSAILSTFITIKFNFAKDEVSKGEKFMGKEVIQIDTLDKEKGILLIPFSMQNRDEIMKRIKKDLDIKVI